VISSPLLAVTVSVSGAAGRRPQNCS
jgi:hypothetical protein